MPAYEAAIHDPPAPVARVSVRNPMTAAVATDVPMLMDSGADVTLLPRSVVANLGIAIDSAAGYELSGFDGNRTIALSVVVDVLLLSRTFKGRFLLTSQDHGILGRNVLSNLSILLDGPQLSWTEHRP